MKAQPGVSGERESVRCPARPSLPGGSAGVGRVEVVGKWDPSTVLSLSQNVPRLSLSVLPIHKPAMPRLLLKSSPLMCHACLSGFKPNYMPAGR